MENQARKIIVTGRVQGVGFRPFVYVTAHELGIRGSVLNGSGKVFIHAEGGADSLDRLEHAVVHAAPPLARPQLASSERVASRDCTRFEILVSDNSTAPEIHVPPDLYTCDDCLVELTGPTERRFGYPFINCTQCGPRYTIITAMPYDRPNTSMADFPLCDDCRAEYESPLDRRFHAQPLACPVCGPTLEFIKALSDGNGGTPDPFSHAPEPPVGASEARDSFFSAPRSRAGARSYSAASTSGARDFQPLDQVTWALGQGLIVAVKGVGGYHLVCDAANEAAVQRLRERKHRPHKPLAVMFPPTGDDGLDAVREHLLLDEVTAAAITDPARPIVLAKKRGATGPGSSLAPSLAPGLRELGVFLPYSPLHHQLLKAFGKPLVATSGNVSGEPVITDNEDAQQRLAAVADAFLHHNRPIVRPADDPVLRPMAGRARVIRLGRGIAPLELQLPARLPEALLATGGHMKVTVALAWDQRIVISPHVGDLDSPRSNDIFQNIISDIQNLYDVKYKQIVCDLHPGYASSRWAAQQGLPLHRVQHHAAHASSLAGEYPALENWLVFTWDGVGYGDDGTFWGGEALAGRPGDWQRRASFRPFHLVGGDKAGREPWRSAAALLWAENKRFNFSVKKDARCDGPGNSSGPMGGFQALLPLAHEAWKRGRGRFETSAAGRLFDAAAALVLGRHMASFEGQGPMELEQIAADGCAPIALPLARDESGVWRSDWEPLLDTLSDSHIPAAERAGIFQETMAQALLDQALAIRAEAPFDAVGLSGGVFQNRHLTERVVERLAGHAIEVRLHRSVPANDGGLCFGQVIEVLARESAL